MPRSVESRVAALYVAAAVDHRTPKPFVYASFRTKVAFGHRRAGGSSANQPPTLYVARPS